MIKNLYRKYKDIIPYIFFGECTTLVNVIAYWCCAYPLGISVVPSTIVAWFLAVLFAYLTNRKWVFHSETSSYKEIIKECLSFYICRLATGIADCLCMFIFVDLLHFNDLIIKITANVMVIIMNYIASKFIIFKSKCQYVNGNDKYE